jgi:2-Cys peroxiredoxin 5
LDCSAKPSAARRYSAIVEDGVIKTLNVEPDGSGLTCSLANVVLKQLKES